jgi:U4/U6.U5 tri-snRNP-associated protein 3
MDRGKDTYRDDRRRPRRSMFLLSAPYQHATASSNPLSTTDFLSCSFTNNFTDRTPSRSRSPPPRDRYHDRRGARSPLPRRPREENPPRSDRERDNPDTYFDWDAPRKRRRSPSLASPDRDSARKRRRSSLPPSPRQPLDTRSSNAPSTRPRADAKHKGDVRMGNGIEDNEEDTEMNRIMGFSEFRSTKNTKVPGNDKNYGVHKDHSLEFRQYMNRIGGFNRELSPS